MLPEIGEAGQARLAAGRVLVAGVGGLGSPAAIYLAAAGIGTLGLVDGDRVETANLNRQIAHATSDTGRMKVESARDRIHEINPNTEVVTHPVRLDSGNVRDVLREYDFVLECTDSAGAKFLVAEACHALIKPHTHAGIRGFEGQAITVFPGRTACYGCVFGENAEPAAGEAGQPSGVLGVLPGVMGVIQATEAIKFLVGRGTPLADTLLVYGALEMSFRRVCVSRNPDCPLCGKGVPK